MPCTRFPGPRAAIAALTLAGLPTDRFLFLGFLPAKAKARADAIAEVAAVRATLVLYESGPRLGDTLAALADGLGDARGSGGARDQQASRGMRHRHARRACGALCRCRRPRARSSSSSARRPKLPRPATRARCGARRSAGAAVAVARGGRSRGAARAAAQARLRPRARARRNEPPGGREARPRGGDDRLLVSAPSRLAHPRPAGAGAGRRSRRRRPPRHARSRSSRSRRARPTRRPRWRSMHGGCGGSWWRPSASLRATCARRRRPHRRHLHRSGPLAAGTSPNIWQG